MAGSRLGNTCSCGDKPRLPSHLAFAVAMGVRGVMETYTSSVWTLAYRRMTVAQPQEAPPAVAEPAQPS